MLVEYYERLRCTRIDMNCRVYRPLCGDSYVDLIKLNSVVTAIQDLSPFKPFDPASIVLDKVAITHISDPKKFYDCVKNALDGWKSLGHESRSHSGMCRVKLKKEKYTHAMQPDARDIEVVLSEWMSLVAKNSTVRVDLRTWNTCGLGMSRLVHIHFHPYGSRLLWPF